jgi:cytochrome c peroxidase
MNKRSIKLITAVLALSGCIALFVMSDSASPGSEIQAATTGIGDVDTLKENYQAWEADYEKTGGDRNVVLSIGWFKGMSAETTKAHGLVKLNLIDGVVSVKASGLSPSQSWDVWLVDNLSGAGRSVLPEPGDDLMRIGTLENDGKVATLEANLGSDAFANFEVDLVVVARTGKQPTEERVLAGTTTLFHRLYRSAKQGQFGVFKDTDPMPERTAEKQGLLARLWEKISPSAKAQIGPIPNPSTPLEQLITQGRNIFFNEQFNGNSRTCGTCHRENNNMTIDAEFIATLPANDPLFVAETNPDLAVNFENPVLMRKFGLILENVDGFDDLAHKFVMRAVPHVLALIPSSINAASFDGVNTFDGTTIPPRERVGWGGDGAPGTGTLREFAIGAITQHFTKTLNRVPGVDFRLPTDAELDALEAFQKSTGRRADPALTGPTPIQFKSEVAARGRVIFNSASIGKCGFCHFNAGAGIAIPVNANFDIGVQNQPDRPADLAGQPNPPDGGFGRSPGAPNGGFGNGSFSTPPVVEAADTGPYFHDNSVATLEGAIGFYNGPAFQNSPAGIALGGIRLDGSQVTAIAAMLRVLNSLENIRSTTSLAERAKVAVSSAQARELLKLATREIEDAIKVLKCADLHPEARTKLITALAHVNIALVVSSNQSVRNRSIDEALGLLAGARADMIIE